MKLPFDENLSFTLVERLEDVFPGSKHVRDVGLEAALDSEVWAFAKHHGFAIVSKDSDIHDLSLFFGSPPKVIWVRLGNCSTADVERLLRLAAGSIEMFEADDDASLLMLS